MLINGRDKINILLIIAGMLANAIPRWLPSPQYDGLYFKGQALSIMLWLMAAKTVKNHNVVLIVWEWAVGLAINNVLKEFIWDPVHVTKIELLIAIWITARTLYRIRQWQLSNKPH